MWRLPYDTTTSFTSLRSGRSPSPQACRRLPALVGIPTLASRSFQGIPARRVAVNLVQQQDYLALHLQPAKHQHLAYLLLLVAPRYARPPPRPAAERSPVASIDPPSDSLSLEVCHGLPGRVEQGRAVAMKRAANRQLLPGTPHVEEGQPGEVSTQVARARNSTRHPGPPGGILGRRYRIPRAARPKRPNGRALRP